MKIKIKKAKILDSDLVFKLTKLAFQHYNAPSLFSTTPALLETKDKVKQDIKEKEVLIAYLDGEAVGSVRFFPINEKDYYLTRLGVLKDYQGYNIGQKLIAAVEEQVKEEGGERITLYSAYRLKGLLRFYQKLGYQIAQVNEDEDYTRAKLVKQLTIDSVQKT